MKSTNNIKLTIFVLTINILADQITKLLATTYLEGKETLSFLYNTIILQYAENSGAFLSLGYNWPEAIKYIVLVVIPILACLYGLYYCAFKLKKKKLVIVTVSIIGGGLGNLIDRLFNDFRVVDFLNFGIGSFRTGILNVADMSVTFGVILLLIDQFRTRKTNAA